jgi:hypothetical protein
MLKAQAYEGIDHDDFLFRLIEAGHTAIFQWIAVYVASVIGLITMIIEFRNYPNSVLYLFIYVMLVLLMTHSICNVLRIMRNQNKWANKLYNGSQKELFYEGRSRFSKAMVDTREEISKREIAFMLVHLVILTAFGLCIWYNCDSFLTILKVYVEKA